MVISSAQLEMTLNMGVRDRGKNLRVISISVIAKFIFPGRLHNEENSGTVCWGTAKCKAQTAEEDVTAIKRNIRELEGQFGEEAIKMKRVLRRHQL